MRQRLRHRWLWVRFPLELMTVFNLFPFPTLVGEALLQVPSQFAILRTFVEKKETECLNIRFSLISCYAGKGVKLL